MPRGEDHGEEMDLCDTTCGCETEFTTLKDLHLDFYLSTQFIVHTEQQVRMEAVTRAYSEL